MRRSAWTVGAAAARGALARRSRLRRQTTVGIRRSSNQANTPPKEAKQGGKLTVLWTGDVDHIDCGQTYYQMGNFICNATQKQLYSYKPDDGAKMVPGPGRGRSAGLRGRQDRHGQDQEGRQVLAAVQQGSHLRRRQVRDRARLLHLGGQRLHRVVLRGPRGREGRRRRPARDRRHHDARSADGRPEVQARGRRRDGLRRAGLRARPRRCRRRTPRSSTPRPRRPTASTSSRPART